MKNIGIQLYSVRENFKTAEMAITTFQKLSRLGFKEAEIAGLYGFSAEQFYDFAQSADMQLVSSSVGLETLENSFETVVADHKTMKINCIFTSCTHVDTVAQAEDTIKRLNAVGKRLAEYGIAYTYHNHSQEYYRLENGVRFMDMLMTGLNDCVRFTFDTAWTQYAGCDVCQWIEQLKGRIEAVHLKDLKCVKNEKGKPSLTICEVGSGNMDFLRIVEAAENAGVKRFCVEQDNCPPDFEESLQQSSAYIHRHFIWK